jgi:hypothetical protein
MEHLAGICTELGGTGSARQYSESWDTGWHTGSRCFIRLRGVPDRFSREQRIEYQVWLQMKFSICIKCGHTKKSPVTSCSHCDFKPRTEQDKARSLILSVAYEIDGVYLGKTKDELNAVAMQIRAGSPYEFDEN